MVADRSGDVVTGEVVTGEVVTGEVVAGEVVTGDARVGGGSESDEPEHADSTTIPIADATSGRCLLIVHLYAASFASSERFNHTVQVPANRRV